MTQIIEWLPQLDEQRPFYLALADSIARDLSTGRLNSGDRLPSQRSLAEQLDMNFSTVARGYREAQSRGLIKTRVGSGTEVIGLADSQSARAQRRDLSDRSMNQAPETENPVLQMRMMQIWNDVGEELRALMRYQSSTGSTEDKAAALRWVARRGIEAKSDQVLVTPGTHAAMLAILRANTQPGDTVCCENITYPGIRGLCNLLQLKLRGLSDDKEGPSPTELSDWVAKENVRVFYTNPDVRNPTTQTISPRRRAELVDVCRQNRIVIIEDDAYGFLMNDAPSTLAMLAPELVYYVAGLSKCLGAGLRVAYLIVPPDTATSSIDTHLKSSNVMVSPLTTRLATRWIETGVSDEILHQIRSESIQRQLLARQILPAGSFDAHPEGFHCWVRAPREWTRHRIVDWMRGHALGAVVSDVFVMHGQAPEAFRLCLGGAASRHQTRSALTFLRDAYDTPPS
ncbi:PLP-dependent aminotransferase family protein [Granulosicoccus antarcticus]|uniref:HTH-type transcriptional regulator TauR n=1 Tax=Granulosicoccus antarcticus IMCC3135 TaxID=1192854 RepID=A0A2Z2NQT7_9GAMM|nr:PLP-dependent aminotransferase family protein [Granulosicoccus antarcticus]ASJ73772.1 HTH-type transcriptional regulator TauR [Granulosicoccus antarcticus IMCC3135]